MSRLPLPVRLAAPLVVALLVAVAVLWTRGAPDRQGGYCVNATVVIAGVLQQADTGTDVGAGPLPDVGTIFAKIADIDAARLQVDTPAAVQADVALLAKRIPELNGTAAKPDPEVSAAFARIAGDYLERCRTNQ